MQEFREPTQDEPGSKINADVLQARINDSGLDIRADTEPLAAAAVIWAAVTYITEYQIGWLALGVGFLVGLGVRYLGRGIDTIFGVAGGVIALFSVALGNFLTALGYVAKAYEMGFLEVLQQVDYTLTFELMRVTFTAMDVLFYGLAIYAGYRYSFRKISRAQLLEGNL